MTLHIFGAGLAGLIAARVLQDMQPVVYDRQEELPDNHKAILRFRSEVVGRATNVPFKKVRVIKAIHGSENEVSDALRYSLKVTGKLQARSIVDTKPVDRWIAPPDFTAKLVGTADVRLGVDFLSWSHNMIRPHRGPVISTIPMPIMMDMFGWEDKPDFTQMVGWTARANIRPDLASSANCTTYFPGREPYYRASITNDTVMVEGMGEHDKIPIVSQDLDQANKAMGLYPSCIHNWQLYQSKYQKIGDLSFDDREKARRFIMWLSQEHQIYSLGRFATWRPKLLLDDLIQDIDIIRRLIEGESHYRQTMENLG